MSTITFLMSELRPIIEYSRKETEFSAPYGLGEPEPSLFFVKDEGIYLMSGAKKRQLTLPLPKVADTSCEECERSNGPHFKGKCVHGAPRPRLRAVVAYAKGYEPSAHDSWEKCRAAVGGDDFCEALPLSWFTRALDRGYTRLHLHVDKDSINCSYDKEAA